MTTLSMVSMRPVSDVQADHSSLRTIALLSCIGLVVSLCLMTFGVDLSASWL
jgi:uncharacterized membrane protein YjjB (DUF3815 family)